MSPLKSVAWSLSDTETRIAVKDDKRTIAYIAIGAEIHAEKIAAAPEMLAALINARHLLASIARIKPFGQQGHDIQTQIDAVITKAQS